MTRDSTFQNYRALLDKIDGFVAGVMRQHPACFACGPGCAKCCVSGISVWRVEAEHIKTVSRLGTQDLEFGGVQTDSRIPSPESRKDRCVFLTERNLCCIYEARPVVCRLWGAPLLIPSGYEGEWGLREHTSSSRDAGALICCNLNFREGIRLEALPSTAILNVDIAIKTLAAINHVYCAENGFDPMERIALASLGTVKRA